MNRSSAIIYFKDLGVRNPPPRWGFKSGSACFKGILWGGTNVQGKRSGATLGQLIDRRKNELDLSASEEVIRRYKRANIRKILKGGTKPAELQQGASEQSRTQQGGSQRDGAGETECHPAEPPHMMRSPVQLPNSEKKGTVRGDNKTLQRYPSMISKGMLDADTRGLHRRDDKEAAQDEHAKDAVDKLFTSREKKKHLMRRIIFKSCHDYLELIDKHEEERGRDDDKFYNCLNSAGKNGDTSFNREGKIQAEGETPPGSSGSSGSSGGSGSSGSRGSSSTPPIDDGYLFEVDNDPSSDANVNVGLALPMEHPRLNVSIFSEVGKKDILESCKRRRNMQSEINKNSDARNMFNRDIYFWLKRKVHRSVGWQLTPGNLNRGEEVIDVTELTCAAGHGLEGGSPPGVQSEAGAAAVPNLGGNLGGNAIGNVNGSGNGNVSGSGNGNVNGNVNASVHGEADRSMDQIIAEEMAAPKLLRPGQGKDPPRGTYLQRRAAPLHFLSRLSRKGADSPPKENSQEGSQERSQDSRQENTQESNQGSNQSSRQPGGPTEAYQGIVDNSTNIFKQIRDNYELFKERNLSPNLLESCEKYINYYYGIEKEEKIKELEKYLHLNFYDMVKEGHYTMDDYNRLLKSQIFFNKEEEAFRHFNLFKQHDLRVNVETYNCLMYASIMHKNAKLGRLIYLQMIKDAVNPNKHTYCILMKAHILDNDIRSAFHLYRKMIKEDIEVDLPVYSTLIDGLLKHKHYERAESFFNYIVTYRNVTPDEVLYTIMIKKCAYKGEAEKCLNFYDAMVSNHMKVTDITLIEIINCLSKRRDYFSQVFHFYNTYLANEMRVNHRLVLYLIVACSSTGNVKRLKEVLKSANRHRVRITEEMCCYIIRTFANNCRREGITLGERHNNIRYAWAVVQELLRRGGEAVGAVRAAEEAVVDRASSAMNAGGGSPIGVSTTSGGAANPPRVNTPHDGGVTPLRSGTKILNSIVQLYINCDYHDYAISMLKYYTQFECLPDVYTFGLLYKLLFYKMEDYGRVLCLYDYMVNQTGVKADEKTLNLVLRAAIKTKSSKSTLYVLRQMYTAKVYPTAKTIKELFHVGRHITDIQILINNMISQQKREIYEENVKESQLIQLNIDEYELNLFREGKTFRTKSQLDQVREQFFRRKERVEKEKRMSKGKKSSDWLPYGQYLQRKRKGGEAYAQRVDRPKPLPIG
ncbi:hypothetical protein C922_03517 [Plasmodium inui San Antonio 1]|uniref:Pentacotripeptide-repeat region of PRORP domain-containing protein n=1 Tax=Plasmodium inui San Antonio 1 TaxID=1237626 RepID=W6ZYW3_9APIC|nr:hypothetical protein C922_03517 [Plasmodium inui San Antonio 1]EUD66047.1 hypothetical protein C922_03517 [Plasmodium inui San Antonio 1]